MFHTPIHSKVFPQNITFLRKAILFVWQFEGLLSVLKQRMWPQHFLKVIQRRSILSKNSKKHCTNNHCSLAIYIIHTNIERVTIVPFDVGNLVDVDDYLLENRANIYKCLMVSGNCHRSLPQGVVMVLWWCGWWVGSDHIIGW